MYMSIFMYMHLPLVHSSVHMGKKSSNLEMESKERVSVIINLLECEDCYPPT